MLSRPSAWGGRCFIQHDQGRTQYQNRNLSDKTVAARCLYFLQTPIQRTFTSHSELQLLEAPAATIIDLRRFLKRAIFSEIVRGHSPSIACLKLAIKSSARYSTSRLTNNYTARLLEVPQLYRNGKLSRLSFVEILTSGANLLKRNWETWAYLALKQLKRSTASRRNMAHLLSKSSFFDRSHAVAASNDRDGIIQAWQSLAEHQPPDFCYKMLTQESLTSCFDQGFLSRLHCAF